MYIVDCLKIDKQGRIYITSLFESIPEKVICIINSNTKELEIIDYKKFNGEEKDRYARCVDEKKRIFLPKWIRDQSKTSTIYVIVNENSKKTHLLLNI